MLSPLNILSVSDDDWQMIQSALRMFDHNLEYRRLRARLEHAVEKPDGDDTADATAPRPRAH